MIESVQARHRGAFQFEDHYDNLCALQDTAPLPAVKAHLNQGVIDLNGDRIRLNDWMPIINTIKINKSLQFIAVRSYYQMPHEDTDEKRAAILRRKLPSIRSKEITHRLVKGLKDCLFVSPTLSCIELQGLALRDRDLQVLVKGIAKSQTLRHLSLEYCRIGDDGLETLCKGLKNTKNINSVNLSGCSLSHRGAESLAAVIKHQGMQRHNEAWRDSLRYRRPDLDRMSGIRRITANNNPMLGDDGSYFLADALKDDLWLKALDLQSCGVSSVGAQSFLEVLKYNTTLVVLDLRRNPLIDRDVMHSLMEQLMLNSNGEDGEYKWIKAEEPEDSSAKQTSRTRRRATKVLNASLGKKTTIKVTPTGSRRRGRVAGSMARKSEMPKSPGLPWRTAMRANRFRGHGPEVSKFLINPTVDASSSFLQSEGEKPTKDFNQNNDYDEIDEDGMDYSVTDTTATADVLIEAEYANTRMTRMRAEAEASISKLEESHLSLDLNNQKDVKVELEQMRRHLREERIARAKADQRVLQLMIENRHLSDEVTQLKKAGASTNRTSILEDEQFLQNIETSFKQFHSFIDMLREAGLEQLVTMAGLDQSKMPFNNNNSNNSNTYNIDSVRPKSSAAPKDLSHLYANIPTSTPDKKTDSKWGATVSITDSFMEETPIHLEGEPGVQKASIYDNETELAKMEADELYTRLVQETRGVLNKDDSDMSRPGDKGEVNARGHLQAYGGDLVSQSLDSCEDPSSYLSDRVEVVSGQTPRSPAAGADSQDEDF